jgi:hypothetical protein
MICVPDAALTHTVLHIFERERESIFLLPLTHKLISQNAIMLPQCSQIPESATFSTIEICIFNFTVGIGYKKYFLKKSLTRTSPMFNF